MGGDLGNSLKEQLTKNKGAITSNLYQRIATIDQKIQETAKEIDARENRSQETLKPVLDALREREPEIVGRYRSLLDDANARNAAELRDLKVREKSKQKNKVELSRLESNKIKLRKEVNDAARNNQIYQITFP